MPASQTDVQLQLADDIASFTHDPEGFARYAYDWEDGGGPRKWQSQVFAEIKQHLENPATRHQPLKIAVASGHGIGKSAGIGMLTDWAMSTCEGCKVVCTAGTGTQLDTKTVPEVCKWFQRSINVGWWAINALSIRFKSAKFQANWRADFVTWSEKNTEPFAGLHNEGKRIILIFDEASAIADKVWEVAEGAMTDENTEIIWIAFGNPTRNSGRFRECFGRFKHRWKTFQIDSRTVEGTNKEQIAKWIEDFGEESDFVKVRVRGEFPNAASDQFIPSDIVEAARKYKATGYDKLPKVLACDVARFGDDQTVIGLRQGRKFRILGRYRGLDTEMTAQKVIEVMELEKPDATIVDGDGIGGGVVDHIKHRGYGNKLFEFHGGATPNDPNMYYNKRIEVWGMVKEWLAAGAEIPDDPELAADLCGPSYFPARGKRGHGSLVLEGKDDMKSRGVASPDCGDTLAMTFAVKLAQRPEVKVTAPVYHIGEMGERWMG